MFSYSLARVTQLVCVSDATQTLVFLDPWLDLYLLHHFCHLLIIDLYYFHLPLQCILIILGTLYIITVLVICEGFMGKHRHSRRYGWVLICFSRGNYTVMTSWIHWTVEEARLVLVVESNQLLLGDMIGHIESLKMLGYSRSQAHWLRNGMVLRDKSDFLPWGGSFLLVGPDSQSVNIC